MASAYTYMNREVIGLTVDTISVISLGIGLGISYAIYLLVAVRDEIISGLLLNEAIRAALHGAGATILSTYVVMIAGLAPWVFSPVLFQNEMSALLILLIDHQPYRGITYSAGSAHPDSAALSAAIRTRDNG